MDAVPVTRRILDTGPVRPRRFSPARRRGLAERRSRPDRLRGRRQGRCATELAGPPARDRAGQRIELLPISSSGHLSSCRTASGPVRHRRGVPINIDVALHLGTAVAVRATMNQASQALGAKNCTAAPAPTTSASPGSSSSPPPGRGQPLLEDFIDRRLGEPWQIAILISQPPCVLLAERSRPYASDVGDLGWCRAPSASASRSASQFAPGVSRSGVTITASRFLGLDRDSAARLLLPQPAITLGQAQLGEDRADRRPARGNDRVMIGTIT